MVLSTSPPFAVTSVVKVMIPPGAKLETVPVMVTLTAALAEELSTSVANRIEPTVTRFSMAMSPFPR
jgi:hypothetical protein